MTPALDHVFKSGFDDVSRLAAEGDEHAKHNIAVIAYVLRAIRERQPQAKCSHCNRRFWETRELACCTIFYPPDEPVTTDFTSASIMTFCNRCATSPERVQSLALECIKENWEKASDE